MPAAGSKGPHAGDPVAASHSTARTLGPGPQASTREDRRRSLRHGEVEIRGRHRAAAGLAEAPGRGGIGLGDGFDDVEEGDGIGFDPVGRARQQQAEQLRVVQPVEQRRWQPARIFDVVGSGRDIGADGLRPGDHRPVACEIGRPAIGAFKGSMLWRSMAFPSAMSLLSGPALVVRLRAAANGKPMEARGTPAQTIWMACRMAAPNRIVRAAKSGGPFRRRGSPVAPRRTLRRTRRLI